MTGDLPRAASIPSSHRLGALLAIVLAAGTAGCCTPIVHRAYAGTALGREDVAVLRQQDGTYVTRVDDQPAPCHKVCCREIHVTPGSHEIGVSLFAADAWAKAPMPIRFVAESGVTYDIRGADTGRTFFSSFWSSHPWTGWIVDTRTQRVVGGQAPDPS
jgi:hypothetical protein